MKVEITSTETKTISGVSSRTNKPYNLNKQKGYLHLEGQKYPSAFEFTLADNATPYPNGFYTVDESSFFIDRFGSLNVSGSLKLVPLAAARAA